MKLTLTIERADGMPISTWSGEFDERGYSCVATASNADYLMTEGMTYEDFEKLGVPWQGVRFRAEIRPSPRTVESDLLEDR